MKIHADNIIETKNNKVTVVSEGIYKARSCPLAAVRNVCSVAGADNCAASCPHSFLSVNPNTGVNILEKNCALCGSCIQACTELTGLEVSPLEIGDVTNDFYYSSIVLRNLNTNPQNNRATWTGPLTGYGFYSVPYETPLIEGHYYYRRFTYKFTTTNQSPTWAQFYAQGGYVGGPTIRNPVAGREYTVSEIRRPTIASSAYGYTRTSGTIYNGPSGAISGVSSYVKEVLCYDVTELYAALKASSFWSVSSESDLKTWCDTNLRWYPSGHDYELEHELIYGDTPQINLCFNKGHILTQNLVETDGLRMFSASTGLRDNTYFDTGSGVGIYNNSGGGTVTHTRVDAKAQGSPFANEHPYVLKITTNGTASPGAGGFVAQHYAKANNIFVEKFVAKIPVGYTVTYACNGQGTGYTVNYIGSRAGTGEWEEYTIVYHCGTSGTFSTGGHVYITGSNNTSVTWYLAYVNNVDVTTLATTFGFNTDYIGSFIQNYVALPDKVRYDGQADKAIDAFALYTHGYDERNIFPSYRIEDQDTAILPSGWSYDTSDVAPGSGAKVSLVQPVNAGVCYFSIPLKVSPGQRFKVSYWVKCKGDMTSFLTATPYYTDSGTALNHTKIVFKSGTITKLTQDLVSGATSMKVTSNANWASKNYSRVGFRSSNTNVSWNDIGISNGVSGSGSFITGVSGSDTVNFASAYTGSTIPSGTVVVECYDGGQYPYPIQKFQLPTDDTWKYVEGYTGVASRDNYSWVGQDDVGTWQTVPVGIHQMRLYLNIYKNTGTVPIKYCGIRVEPISTGSSKRSDEKVIISK